jgi:hypothetical protein
MGFSLYKTLFIIPCLHDFNTVHKNILVIIKESLKFTETCGKSKLQLSNCLKLNAMKIKYILFFALAGALAGCSTAYRSAQTPDDVYYSPAPVQNSYVTKSDRQDRDSYVTPESEQDENSYYYRNEDMDIRRGISDPFYRNSITFSMGYGYNPYSLFPYNSFNNPFYGYDAFGYSPYGYSPYGYSPYGYSPYGFKGMYNPYNSFGYSPYSFGYSPYMSYYSSGYYPAGHMRVNTNTGARKYNLNGYNTTSRTAQPSGNAQPIRTETTAPVRSTGVGNVIRRVFTPSERRSYSTPNSNNNTRTYDNNNTRTYNNNRSNTNETRSFDRTPSVSTPSSSSGNSSSNSSSAPVRTFRR